jgi:P27 family predicted phage terminase small subunit
MGRRAKSDELKERAGNPGKRALKDSSPSSASSEETLPAAPFEVPDFLTHPREREIFSRIVGDYLRMRIARKPDLVAYARWAHYVHRWIVTKETIGETGAWYTTTSKHQTGELYRQHPAAKDQFQLERMLQSLEDRLGLNPAARQNLLRGLGNLPAALGGLFGDDKPQEKPAPQSGATEPAKVETPLGWLQQAGDHGKPN